MEFRSMIFRPLYEQSYPNYQPQYTEQAAVPKELNWTELVANPVQNMFTNIVAYIPNLVAAILILLAGWVSAKVLAWFAGQFMKAIHFNAIAEKSGIAVVLKDCKPALTPESWFQRLVFWVVMVITLVLMFDRMRFGIAATSLDHILYFLLSTITALLILVLGMFLSAFVSKIVYVSATSVNIPRPGVHAAIIQGAILFFTFLFAAAKIGLAPEFLFIFLGIIFITMCITFIVAFGIGGRDWAAKVLNKLFQ